MFINYKFLTALCIAGISTFAACAKSGVLEVDEIATENQNKGNIYTVKSATELNSLKLHPGDKVILKSGEWKNAQLIFKGKGVENRPIIFVAEKGGEVRLTGNSNAKIDGEFLIIDGLSFSNGYSLKDDVIVFTKNSISSRLTNSSIVNYNHLSKEIDYKWLSLYGKKNRVDHCEFTGKTHQGTTLVVWLSDEANHHQIDNNYFGPRPALGVNGGETIRIGTSQWSMSDSYTLVENNIFDRCDGEMEIISIKSGHNLIKNNLFYDCDGTLTFRHGNNSEASGNFFIGNKKANTGGIRIIGENQIVKDNYLQGLTGKGLRAAISAMNALEKPELNEYFQVKNAVIKDNVIVNCSEAFVFGAGKSETRSVKPNGITLVNNYVIDVSKLLVLDDKPDNFVVKNNFVKGTNLIEGFSDLGQKLIQDKLGIWQIEGKEKTLFWLKEKIGPEWKVYKNDYKF